MCDAFSVARERKGEFIAVQFCHEWVREEFAQKVNDQASVAPLLAPGGAGQRGFLQNGLHVQEDNWITGVDVQRVTSFMT